MWIIFSLPNEPDSACSYLPYVFFAAIKLYARFAIKIYCRNIVVNKPAYLGSKGPLLLACNHPNSFLDGIVLTTLFRENIYSLARGDAFRKPWHAKLLRWLHLLPVFRTSEGVENLEYNYTTFKACKEVFRKNGAVIIFSEGRCVNEWRLRPLKKGTARLATAAWEEGIPLTVLPVGLNYTPFRNFGKNIFIQFGDPLDREAIMQNRTDGKLFLAFNESLNAQLEGLVYQILPGDKTRQRILLALPVPRWKKAVLVIPAFTGFLLHAPFYFAAKALTKKYFDNDHFDSVLAGILMLAYPVYLLLGCLLALLVAGWLTALATAVLFPVCAWACMQLKPQV